MEKNVLLDKLSMLYYMFLLLIRLLSASNFSSYCIIVSISGILGGLYNMVGFEARGVENLIKLDEIDQLTINVTAGPVPGAPLIARWGMFHHFILEV